MPERACARARAQSAGLELQPRLSSNRRRAAPWLNGVVPDGHMRALICVNCDSTPDSGRLQYARAVMGGSTRNGSKRAPGQQGLPTDIRGFDVTHSRRATTGSRS